MKTNSTNNDAALDAYVAAQAKTRDALHRILAALDAHQDRQPPGAIHWGHVGDLNHVIQLLAEIEEFLAAPPATCPRCGGAVRGVRHVHPEA